MFTIKTIYFLRLKKEKKEKSLNTNSNSSKNISSSNHKTSPIQNISKMEIEEEENNNNKKEEKQVSSFKMNYMDYVRSAIIFFKLVKSNFLLNLFFLNMKSLSLNFYVINFYDKNLINSISVYLIYSF